MLDFLEGNVHYFASSKKAWAWNLWSFFHRCSNACAKPSTGYSHSGSNSQGGICTGKIMPKLHTPTKEVPIWSYMTVGGFTPVILVYRCVSLHWQALQELFITQNKTGHCWYYFYWILVHAMGDFSSLEQVWASSVLLYMLTFSSSAHGESHYSSGYEAFREVYQKRQSYRVWPWQRSVEGAGLCGLTCMHSVMPKRRGKSSFSADWYFGF